MFEKGALLPLLNNVCIACIGPVTAKTAEAHGLTVHVMPSEYTISGLTEAICAHFSGSGN
jgi:uroporphyrinogen-III synthase